MRSRDQKTPETRRRIREVIITMIENEPEWMPLTDTELHKAVKADIQQPISRAVIRYHRQMLGFANWNDRRKKDYGETQNAYQKER